MGSVNEAPLSDKQKATLVGVGTARAAFWTPWISQNHQRVLSNTLQPTRAKHHRLN
jgi:hypothetical protein